ncbi:MAG: FAD-dependent oxidoreductase [Sphingomicrobium sp.]
MDHGSDILVIGGGIAGLSAAAALSASARVTVIEVEEQIGFHSSGRSATMLHYALGDRLVRALTLASRPWFDDPHAASADAPLSRRMAVLVHARDEERAALDALHSELSRFVPLDRLDARQVHALCPLLKDDARHGIADHDALHLDPHAMLQANLRQLRGNGGKLATGQRVARIEHRPGSWAVTSQKGDRWSAPLLVNAAGAWADSVARLAGVAPLGIAPKRRTIITFDPPAGTALEGLPFAKTVGDELYFAPESGRLLASPMDEVPSEPCDAQPDELEVALAAHRMEQRTIVSVARIHSRWAGLRSFTPDGHPAIGLAADAEGFFWLAGQGGFGLQTSPAIAAIAFSLLTGASWPVADVGQEALGPGRFAVRGA